MITPLLDPTLVTAGTCLVGLVVVASALLKAWQGWLDLKQQEIGQTRRTMPDENPGMGTARIELADLKERIRKLEAIASGVEL
ncbi:MAG: hypothetical protein ACJLS3_06670 [Erythrobacter sp.]|jgi:hypothetical protein